MTFHEIFWFLGYGIVGIVACKNFSIIYQKPLKFPWLVLMLSEDDKTLLAASAAANLVTSDKKILKRKKTKNIKIYVIKYMTSF